MLFRISYHESEQNIIDSVCPDSNTCIQDRNDIPTQPLFCCLSWTKPSHNTSVSSVGSTARPTIQCEQTSVTRDRQHNPSSVFMHVISLTYISLGRYGTISFNLVILLLAISSEVLILQREIIIMRYIPINTSIQCLF